MAIAASISSPPPIAGLPMTRMISGSGETYRRSASRTSASAFGSRRSTVAATGPGSSDDSTSWRIASRLSTTLRTPAFSRSSASMAGSTITSPVASSDSDAICARSIRSVR